MSQNREQVREVAAYYDEVDTTQDLERAERDGSVVLEPMVTTSLRLPRATMNDLRDHAERRGLLLKLVREAGRTQGKTTTNEAGAEAVQAKKATKKRAGKQAPSKETGKQAASKIASAESSPR